MNVNFSSHKGTAELDQHIEQAIKDNDPAQIFDLVEKLATLPDGTYEKYKIRFKDVFKRRLSISGLDKAVKEARKNRKRAKIAAKQTHLSAPVNARPRPVVEVGGQLRDVVQDALTSLELWNKDDPTIFVQSGRLVTVAFSEKKGPSIVMLTLSSLRHKMTQAADYVRISETSEDMIAIPVDPPLDVVRIILEGITNAADYPFPTLAGVTELPIIRPDGSLHQTTGYDQVTEQVYIPGELNIPPIPETPTKEEVQKAVVLLDYLLSDFPFTDNSSKATIIADIETVVIRSLIDGQVPLTLLDAPTPGTGKTLLAILIGIVATGRYPSVEGPTGDEEEWRKKMITWLMKSPSVIVIDNIHHPLESSTLESALTSPYVEDRLLATNTSVRVANRAVWLATGNNIRTGHDMARRCVKCRLDAKAERPHKRDPKKFKIQGKIEKWVLEHRADIVAACLVLMRNWYAQGCPEPTCTPLANFEEWRMIVGGILQAAGIPDFLRNLDDEDENNSLDEKTAAWKALIRAIYDVYGSEPFTFQKLAKRMLDKDDQAENLCESLPSSLTRSFGSYQRSQGADPDFAAHLGNAFRTKKGQVFDGLRLETSKIKATGNKTQWQIVINDDSTPDEPTVLTRSQNEDTFSSDEISDVLDSESPESEALSRQYDQACDLINELELAGASIEYLPDGKRNLHAPNSTPQQKAAWKKRIVTLDVALRDIHADMHPSNNGDSISQEPAPADTFTEAFKAPDKPIVYAICPICAKVRDIWSHEKGTYVCGTDHSKPDPDPDPDPPKPTGKKERAYVDVIQGHGITESGTTIDLPANCSLVDMARAVQQIGNIERVFLCGTLPDDYEQWLLDTAIHQDYTTGERGHYFDPKDHTGHVARFVHRVTGDKLEIRSMSAWLGDSEYTVEQARDAVLLLTQYLQSAFTDDTVAYATPSQTFQQIWTRQNRLERKSYPLLPQNIRNIIHATSGQGRVELCTQEQIKKLSELHYYDGIFMYAGLTWGMATELETHDHKNVYAGKVPARYRIRYTVPTDWQHIGLFMTPKGNETWFYPGDKHQGQTFETWADGAELDVLKVPYGDVETGMKAWNITILERIVFKLEKDSEAKKPLDAIIKKLVTMREQVEKDARLDTSRAVVYKLVRGMVRNIVLHGIGAFHRNKRDITVILRRDEVAPDTINAAPKELGDDLYIYSVPGSIDSYSEQFDHPEYSALVWARCRARMTKWALSLPRESIVAIRTDAIATTQEVAEWKASEKVGTLREKWTIRKQLKAPHTYEELDTLVDRYIKEGK